MSRLGHALIALSLAAFGIGAFALGPPYHVWALVTGAVILALGIVLELIFITVLEEHISERVADPLKVGARESGNLSARLGPDAFPKG